MGMVVDFTNKEHKKQLTFSDVSSNQFYVDEDGDLMLRYGLYEKAVRIADRNGKVSTVIVSVGSDEPVQRILDITEIKF